MKITPYLQRTARRRHRQAGQSLTEFVIMLAMVLSIVVTMLLFLAVFLEYDWRILSLIGLEVP